MTLLARDVRELIEHLGIPNCVLVGHSMGGMVAQMLGVEGVPSLVALVLVTTIASDASDQLISKRIARDTASGSFVEAFDKHFSLWFDENVGPAYMAHTRDEMLRTPDCVALALVKDYWNFDLTAGLAQINVPTLVVGGHSDKSSPASQARQLAHHIPNAKLHIMDCGHFPMIEQSEELTVVLADFLGSNSKPSTRIEHDLLGEVRVPATALYGAQTQRAIDNFPLAGEKRIGDYPALIEALALRLRKKGDELGEQRRLARTCLQDAVDTSYGDFFNAYASCVDRLRSRLYAAVDRLHTVNLGGTIVGREADTPSAYREDIVPALCLATGDDQYVQATDLYDAAQNPDDMIGVSSALDILARALIKICKDLRLLSSGPEGGIAEIRLPAAQPGSSTMPGKVNPVIPEFVIQTCFQVIGNHAACASTLDHGELDLNVWESSIVFNILDSFESLTSATHTLAESCIAGIRVDAERSRTHAEATIPFLTRLAREHGYARISKLCSESGGDLQQVKQRLLREGLLPS